LLEVFIAVHCTFPRGSSGERIMKIYDETSNVMFFVLTACTSIISFLLWTPRYAMTNGQRAPRVASRHYDGILRGYYVSQPGTRFHSTDVCAIITLVGSSLSTVIARLSRVLDTLGDKTGSDAIAMK